MKHIKATDLRNHQTDIIQSVRDGESVTITRNGRPMAVIIPITEWEKMSTVSVQQLADLYQVDPETVIGLARSLPGDKVVYRSHTLPGPILLYPAAATRVGEMLERNTEYPLTP